MRRSRLAALAASTLLASLVLATAVAPVSAEVICTVSAPPGGVLDLTSLGTGEVACGGPGADYIRSLDGGTFYGGRGDDSVHDIDAGAAFYGGAGNDRVINDNFGTFSGGSGNDSVFYMAAEHATYYGGGGNDRLTVLNWGYFNGGGGQDTACYVNPDPAYGMLHSVEDTTSC